MSKLFRTLVLSLMLATALFTTSTIYNSAIAAPVWKSDSLYSKANIPSLDKFSASLQQRSKDLPAGLYIAGKLALPIVQQPSGNPAYVSLKADVVTEFAMADKYGTLGLLAHNNLAGADFNGLEPGQFAAIVYGDGRVEYYRISLIERYQAISPLSPTSDFIDANGARVGLTTLFNRIYGHGNRLVLQTCIAAQGNPSWGRLFVIAEPITEEVHSALQQSSFLLRSTNLGLMAR